MEAPRSTKPPHRPEVGATTLDKNDPNYNRSTSLSRGANMEQLITGYYAIANCYIIDTQSKERNNIFQNYNVKKVPLGLPSVFGSVSD
jgi:hypothetical protein